MRGILGFVVAVVVAFVFQLAWLVTRIVLEHNGIESSARVAALSVASLAASYLTIAAASMGLARRLTGTRRLGAWIATLGSLAFVAGLALYEVFIHSAADHPRVMMWAIDLRVREWSIADAIVIVGFAVAAGRTGFWLAPPTVGLALMNVQPGISTASWPPEKLLVLLAIKAALVVLIVHIAEREAARCNPEPARARSALRRCELAAWAAAVLSPITSLAWFASPTFYVAVASACASMAVLALFATAAWSNAPAFAKSPAWAWYAAAMLSVWGVVRTLRSWLLAFAHHWGDLEGTPLKPSHWSTAIPGLLASLCALSALIVFGRRANAHDVERAGVVAAIVSALAFSSQCALPGQTVAHVVSGVAASLAAARAYRVGRFAVDGDAPRARLV